MSVEYSKTSLHIPFTQIWEEIELKGPPNSPNPVQEVKHPDTPRPQSDKEKETKNKTSFQFTKLRMSIDEDKK